MKKTKILTVLGVLLAMGITACGGKTSSKESSQPTPSSSSQPAPSSSSQAPSSSSQAPASKDATGHIWGANADVAASGEGAAYKKASCTENDQFIKLTINQSVVTNANRKANTPDGYLKLGSDGNECSFKFNYDSYAEGKLYLFGCMDGYSSNYTKNFCYVNGTPNVEVKINGKAVDISAQKDVKFQDIFGEESNSDNLSRDDYALLGDIAIENGVNEINYKRLQTLNMLVKDFVLVVKNGTKPAHTHTADTEWHKDATNHWHECTAGDGEKMNSEAHKFGDWVESPAAKPCQDKGSKSRTCSVCGYVETEELALAEHTWVADESKADVPATCIAGKHFEKCSVCGETREVAIPKDPDAEHDFSDWEIVTPASCAQGQKKRVCSRCGLEDFDVIPPLEGAEHQWGEKETVAGDAENGYVGYEKQVCSVCGTWKVFMKVADATLDECDYTDSGQTKHGISVLKDGDLANTGGYKLSKNGMSFSFKFKFDTLADVKIYQHGCMDNWSSNGNMNRTYYDGGNEAQGKCNFEFEVNSAKVQIDKETAKKKAQELVATRADDDPLKTITCPSGGTGYSEYGELFIGEAELVNGDNTFTYRRLGSYNYIVDEIIVEVTPVDHVHEAGENWVDTDETYHWKNCTHSDGHKMNKAEHDYTGQEWEVVTPSTCTTKGVHRRACTVCGHWQVEELPLAEHTWVADESKTDVPATCAAGIHYEKCSVCGEKREVAIAPIEDHAWVEGDAVKNSDNKDVIPMTCSKGCGRVGAKMSENDYSSIDGSDTTPDALRPNQGKPITYKIVVAKAGKYSLEFGMFCKSNDTVTMDKRGFQVKVNDANAVVTIDGSKTPKDLGMTSTNAVQIELCSEITLKEGENTIAIICAGYRLHYKGNLVVLGK